MEGLVKEDQHSLPRLVTQGKKHRLQEWGQRMKDGARLLISSQTWPENQKPGSNSKQSSTCRPHSSTETVNRDPGPPADAGGSSGPALAPRRGP